MSAPERRGRLDDEPLRAPESQIGGWRFRGGRAPEEHRACAERIGIEREDDRLGRSERGHTLRANQHLVIARLERRRRRDRNLRDERAGLQRCAPFRDRLTGGAHQRGLHLPALAPIVAARRAARHFGDRANDRRALARPRRRRLHAQRQLSRKRRQATTAPVRAPCASDVSTDVVAVIGFTAVRRLRGEISRSRAHLHAGALHANRDLVEFAVGLRRRVVPEQIVVAEIVDDAAKARFEQRRLADPQSVGDRHHHLERAVAVRASAAPRTTGPDRPDRTTRSRGSQSASS